MYIKHVVFSSNFFRYSISYGNKRTSHCFEIERSGTSIMMPYIFFIITVIMIFLNFLAFMQVLSLLITLPFLFISIYMTLYSFMRNRVYRPMRSEERREE